MQYKYLVFRRTLKTFTLNVNLVNKYKCKFIVTRQHNQPGSQNKRGPHLRPTNQG